jgi:hypothetical protein
LSIDSANAPLNKSPAESAPNWTTISREAHCPLCEYNLRGLIEPRCPECGYKFEWAAMLNPSLQIHPYVFEHHPNRPIRSFWLTLRGGLRPWRFWTQLKPTHTVRARRILGYWLLMILGTLAALVTTTLILLLARKLADSRHTLLVTTHQPIQRLPFRMRFSSTRVWWRSFVVPLTLTLGTLEVALPWLTLASLMIFQASMRRKGMKSVHLLRCVFYSADVLLWANLLVLLASLATFVFWLIAGEADPNNIFGRYAPYRMLVYFYLPVWGVFCYRLFVACRKYLQLEHVIAVLIASQVIVALSVPAAVVVIVSIKELL